MMRLHCGECQTVMVGMHDKEGDERCLLGMKLSKVAR